MNANSFDYSSLLHVWSTIRFADGNTQFTQKIYQVLPNAAIAVCSYAGTTRWSNDMLLACWGEWRQNFYTIPSVLNDGDDDKVFTSFLAVMISFLVSLGLSSKIGLDTTSSGIFFVSVLGFFWLLEWIFAELFFLTVFVLIIVVLLKSTIWR